MELTIDEKMQLVQKMRADADAQRLQNYATVRAQSGYGRYDVFEREGSAMTAQERNGRFARAALRTFFALCLFAGYCYLQYAHRSVAGTDAADVVQCISSDGFFLIPSGEK